MLLEMFSENVVSHSLFSCTIIPPFPFFFFLGASRGCKRMVLFCSCICLYFVMAWYILIPMKNYFCSKTVFKDNVLLVPELQSKEGVLFTNGA